MGSGENKVEVKICPRCGKQYSYLERRTKGGNRYVYAVHVKKVKGKKKVKKCYLGPLDSYKYVSMLHKREGLVLEGLIANDRVARYIYTLAEYLRNRGVEELTREEVYALRKLSETILEVLGEKNE